MSIVATYCVVQRPRTIYPLILSLGFKHTVASVLGQPDSTKPWDRRGLRSHSTGDHRPSEFDTQPPPSVVHLLWFARRRRGAESP